MRFEWDQDKNRRNLTKHGIRFETAILVFDDPFALTQRDDAVEDDERWLTMGAIAPGAILLVVHTFDHQNGEDIVRIISARAAESHERRAYEEANQRAAPRDRRNRRKAKRGH